MKLVDLKPHFIKFEERTVTWTRVVGDPLTWKSGDPTEQVTGPKEYHINVDTFAEAQGMMYLCPKCLSHCVLTWFAGRGVPDNAVPGPGRWSVTGSGFHDITLGPGPNNGGKPSVQLIGGCDAHFNVKNGDVTIC